MMKRIAVILVLLVLMTSPAIGWQEFGKSAAVDSSSASNPFNLSALTSDNITEGTVNLYLTNTRARAALSASGLINYNSGTGTFSHSVSTSPYWLNGTNNWFSLYSDNLTEGTTNLFFTNARAVSAIGSGTSGNWYNGTNHFYALYTDNITEGMNKWYSDVLARAAISGSGLIGYNGSTGVISLTPAATNRWLEGTGNFFSIYHDNITGALNNSFVNHRLSTPKILLFSSIQNYRVASLSIGIER